VPAYYFGTDCPNKCACKPEALTVAVSPFYHSLLNMKALWCFETSITHPTSQPRAIILMPKQMLWRVSLRPPVKATNVSAKDTIYCAHAPSLELIFTGTEHFVTSQQTRIVTLLPIPMHPNVDSTKGSDWHGSSMTKSKVPVWNVSPPQCHFPHLRFSVMAWRKVNFCVYKLIFLENLVQFCLFQNKSSPAPHPVLHIDDLIPGTRTYKCVIEDTKVLTTANNLNNCDHVVILRIAVDTTILSTGWPLEVLVVMWWRFAIALVEKMAKKFFLFYACVAFTNGKISFPYS